MFGLMAGLPDFSEMAKTIDEFKQNFERLVAAVEKTQSDVAQIKARLGIDALPAPEGE